VDEGDFDAFYEKHRKQHPPPVGTGMVALECAGYACGRGAAWISFDVGVEKKAKTAQVAEEENDLSAAQKKKQAKVEAYGISGAICTTEVVSERVMVKVFPKNKVGLHVVQLQLNSNGNLELVAVRRFDLYNRTEQAHAEFTEWVDCLPSGSIVCIAISDTAIAKKRPMEESAYVALRQLGAPVDMEVIGYRNPFVFLGVKGLAPGEARFLLDKRAQSKTVLRLDAKLVGGKGGHISLKSVKDSSINAIKQCPDREKEGYIFKNCQTVVKGENGKLIKKKK
jgi:hypothetical protein